MSCTPVALSCGWGVGCQNDGLPMSAPGVSVVIPCYNAERYVAAAIRSAWSQGPAVEVIVVDDGSRDGSVDAVLGCGIPVTLVRQANAGVAAARNAGAARAQGRWVAFLDADDLWLPGKLSAQLDLLAAHPQVRLAYTAWEVWPSEDVEPAAGLLERLQESAADAGRWAGASGWIYPELLLDCVVWTSTVLAERALLEELGGFDPGLRIGEDYDLWLRASRVTPILRVCAPLALYRIHGSNTTRRAPERNHKAEVVARAIARWGYGGPDGRQADRSSVSRQVARSWIDFAAALLHAGDPARARGAALTALQSDPSLLGAWKMLGKTLVRPPGLARR
ncbi:MAG: glycosyltransferase [Pseudomonadota bacterium]|jgi:glycosyltransferase involved in cell wall biosynthesis|nr:glycosyltransferase [Rubrivivax sp.]